jgi:hypothetical protein
MIRSLLALTRRSLAILAGLATIFGQSTSGAQQETPAELEILSKVDAIRLFGLTRSEWLQNVRSAVAAGSAMQTGDAIGIGMTMQTKDGDLLTVRPDYSNGDGKPAFILVSVGYRAGRANRLTEQGLRDAIAAAKRQMAPEFDVHGDIERVAGGVALFFTILDQR